MAVLALMIIIPLTFAVIATIDKASLETKNALLEKNNEDLNMLVSAYEEFKNNGKEFSSADFYTLMERLGVKKEDFILLLYEKDPDVLKVLDNQIDQTHEVDEQPPDENSGIGAVAPEPTTPVTTAKENANPTIVPASEPNSGGGYADLYRDLFVEKHIEGTRPRYRDDAGYIYLTFDDGPSYHTTSILSYLKKHNVTATFFVIPGGESSRLLNMIIENGHAIGVHSVSHDYNEIYSSVEAFLADFKKAYDLIYRQTGIKPEIFRFPGGSKNNTNRKVQDEIIAEMTRRGFVYFDWNVDSRDYAGANWTQMYKTVLSEVADNTAKGRRSIILMHDRSGGLNTVLVVEDIVIALLKDSNGYKFGTLDRNVRPIQF